MKNILIFGSLFLMVCIADANPSNLKSVVEKIIKLESFNTWNIEPLLQAECNASQVAGHALKNKIKFNKQGSGTLFLDKSKCELSPKFNFIQIQLVNAAKGEVIITIADVEGSLLGLAVRNSDKPKTNFHQRYKAYCQLVDESMSCELENNGGHLTYVLYKVTQAN